MKGRSQRVRLRRELLIAIRQIVEEKEYSTSDLVKKLSLAQPHVSQLLRINKDFFSTEQLLYYLTCLGYCLKVKYNDGKFTVTLL